MFLVFSNYFSCSSNRIYERGTKEASNLGIEKTGIKAIRSASVTAIGPSLSPVITLLSLVAVIGAPTTWMRLCDVGAARTELGVISLTSNLSGVEVGSAAFGAEAFRMHYGDGFK